MRGDVYVAVPEVDPTSGELVDPGPVWIPYVSSTERVMVPEVLRRDGGAAVRDLPTLKAFGADLVCQQYAWFATRRVETSQKSYVLGQDDVVAALQAQVGGTAVVAVSVMQLVGDPEEAEGGHAYRTLPCFRFRMPLDGDGQTSVPVPNAIGWLVHHPEERASRLDQDWQNYDPADRHQPTPPVEVRLDRAVTGSGDMVYAPILDTQSSTLLPTSAGSGSDVLPGQAEKKRRFRRS